MSPVDPKSLEPFAERAVYERELKCRKCGYSLIGLPVGAPCPECGTATKRKRDLRRYGDTLIDAPPEYLRNLSLGFVVMAAAGLLCLVFYGFGVLVPFGGVLAAGAGVGWWFGVFVVTGPRRVTGRTEVDTRLEHWWLRLANRVTQGAWAGAGVVQASLYASVGGLGGVTGAPTGVVLGQFLALVGCLTVGLVGLGPLCAQLGDLADWANDTNMGMRLRSIALVVTVCGGYIVLVAVFVVATRNIPWLVTVQGALGLVVFVAWPALVIGLLAFFWTLFQMSRMSLWAVSNAASAREKDARLKAKYEEARRRAGA